MFSHYKNATIKMIKFVLIKRNIFVFFSGLRKSSGIKDSYMYSVRKYECLSNDQDEVVFAISSFKWLLGAGLTLDLPLDIWQSQSTFMTLIRADKISIQRHQCAQQLLLTRIHQEQPKCPFIISKHTVLYPRRWNAFQHRENEALTHATL